MWWISGYKYSLRNNRINRIYSNLDIKYPRTDLEVHVRNRSLAKVRNFSIPKNVAFPFLPKILQLFAYEIWYLFNNVPSRLCRMNGCNFNENRELFLAAFASLIMWLGWVFCSCKLSKKRVAAISNSFQFSHVPNFQEGRAPATFPMNQILGAASSFNVDMAAASAVATASISLVRHKQFWC